MSVNVIFMSNSLADTLYFRMGVTQTYKHPLRERNSPLSVYTTLYDVFPSRTDYEFHELLHHKLRVVRLGMLTWLFIPPLQNIY